MGPFEAGIMTVALKIFPLPERHEKWDWARAETAANPSRSRKRRGRAECPRGRTKLAMDVYG